MMIPPLVGNPYNGYIKSYYWIDELIPPGTNGTSDPSTDATGQRGYPLKIWSFQNCDGGNECCIRKKGPTEPPPWNHAGKEKLLGAWVSTPLEKNKLVKMDGNLPQLSGWFFFPHTFWVATNPETMSCFFWGSKTWGPGGTFLLHKLLTGNHWQLLTAPHRCIKRCIDKIDWKNLIHFLENIGIRSRSIFSKKSWIARFFRCRQVDYLIFWAHRQTSVVTYHVIQIVLGKEMGSSCVILFSLVVSTHFKTISQLGSFPQGSGWNFHKSLSCHHLVFIAVQSKSSLVFFRVKKKISSHIKNLLSAK